LTWVSGIGEQKEFKRPGYSIGFLFFELLPEEEGGETYH
jgi:hypothetical protein